MKFNKEQKRLIKEYARRLVEGREERFTIPADRATLIAAAVEKYIDAEDLKMSDKIQKIIGKDDQYEDLTVAQWNKLEKLLKVKTPVQDKPLKVPSKIKVLK